MKTLVMRLHGLPVPLLFRAFRPGRALALFKNVLRPVLRSKRPVFCQTRTDALAFRRILQRQFRSRRVEPFQFFQFAGNLFRRFDPFDFGRGRFPFLRFSLRRRLSPAGSGEKLSPDC